VPRSCRRRRSPHWTCRPRRRRRGSSRAAAKSCAPARATRASGRAAPTGRSSPAPPARPGKQGRNCSPERSHRTVTVLHRGNRRPAPFPCASLRRPPARHRYRRRRKPAPPAGERSAAPAAPATRLRRTRCAKEPPTAVPIASRPERAAAGNRGRPAAADSRARPVLSVRPPAAHAEAARGRDRSATAARSRRPAWWPGDSRRSRASESPPAVWTAPRRARTRDESGWHCGTPAESGRPGWAEPRAAAMALRVTVRRERSVRRSCAGNDRENAASVHSLRSSGERGNGRRPRRHPALAQDSHRAPATAHAEQARRQRPNRHQRRRLSQRLQK
jgi:hypothetical protein